MSDSTSRLPARVSLEQLRKQAKELLRLHRAGDESARRRFASVTPRHPEPAADRPVTLADAQFVIAREYGFDTWANLKHHVDEVWPARITFYERLAEDLERSCNSDNIGAVERLQEAFGGTFSAEQVREEVSKRLGLISGSAPADSITLEDTRRVVARLFDFQTWDDFESSITRPPARPAPAVHGLTATPPFYRINRDENWIEPRPPLSPRDWDEILDAMREHRVTGLRAAGQMTDAALARLTDFTEVTSLHLEGCRRVTDAGLRNLARMPQLQRLNLTGCSISDDGLAILSQLPGLREFYLYHHQGISDTGLANLHACHQLEIVDLLGSNAGDGVIRALAGKAKLRNFKSGNHVTDAGIEHLHEFPVFKTWQGTPPAFNLMSFEAEPNYLLLRGDITGAGLAGMKGLDGLFALNLDNDRLVFTAAELGQLAALPNLGWLGVEATDDNMASIADLPRLRMLMCQDTKAGDSGFVDLSRSRSIEYIWGRRCYNLGSRGFAALARMPALRGLSVSCKNVEDHALAALPDFPSLIEFMPMDVQDEGFRYVGRCERLQELYCMYCRETGDAATGHIAGLKHLKTYYAGHTRITDRSLEILAGMHSLERVTLWSCSGVTNAGVALLAALPKLRELSVDSMPRVTREAIASFPAHVRVSLGT